MDPNNNNFVDLGGSSNSDSSQGQSQSSSNEEPSTQVMDEADRVNDDLLQECQEEDPNAWAKLEAINRAYKNIILTQDETSFGKQGVDYDITSEFAHASSRNDAAIMSSQVRSLFSNVQHHKPTTFLHFCSFYDIYLIIVCLLF